MPIPKPRDSETKDDFLERCMGDDVMNEEYPDASQRTAICNQQWEEKMSLTKQCRLLLNEIKQIFEDFKKKMK